MISTMQNPSSMLSNSERYFVSLTRLAASALALSAAAHTLSNVSSVSSASSGFQTRGTFSVTANAATSLPPLINGYDTTDTTWMDSMAATFSGGKKCEL